MIPPYPLFGPVELACRDHAAALTDGFEPYSDFNFTSLWSWDVDGRVALSELHGNLVARFVDYQDGRAFYSFLGRSQVDDTIAVLLDRGARDLHATSLRWVPSAAIEHAHRAGLCVEPDPDQRDYIFELERLCTYRGSELSAKRNFVHRFTRSYTARVDEIDLSCPQARMQMDALFTAWSEGKTGAERERQAFDRLMHATSDFPALRGVGVWIDGCLCAASIVEPLPERYAIVHFEKAETRRFVGIGPYLVQQTARMLFERGCRWLNYEQDLGIEGLRKSKSSYGPVRFLSKYSVFRADVKHIRGAPVLEPCVPSQGAHDAARPAT